MAFRTDPPAVWAAVTPSDATVFADPSKVLYVGSTGNVAVRNRTTGTTVTFVGCPTGHEITGDFDQVLSTGTTASSILRGFG